MTLYINANTGSSLAAMELSKRPDGNYSFFYIKKPEDVEPFKEILKASGLKLDILSQAQTGDKSVVIARTSQTSQQMLRDLSAQGEQLHAEKPGREFHPWKWRGNFSNLGQGLTLASSLSKGQIQKDKLAFSALNLTANAVNLIFGGSKNEDVNRLRTVKEQFNALLTPYLSSGASLPVVDEKPAALVRAQAREKPRTIGQNVYGFMQRNSVLVGEIGLRYIGALAMVFPTEQWKAAGAELRKGALANAFKKAVNNKADKTNLRVGLIYLAGKSIGLLSKVPDPYNPEPPSELDTIREKVLFRASSVIEASAAGTLAYGNYKKGDMVGAAGGASLVSGLSTRAFAKFGTREVNMEELYAFVAEGLAKVPPAKLEGAMAETAGFLRDHFEDKKLEFGNIYMQLRTDLYRYHNIAVYPETKVQPPAAEIADAPAFGRQWMDTVRGTSSPAGADKGPPDRTFAASPPPADYTQKLQQSAAADMGNARG